MIKFTKFLVFIISFILFCLCSIEVKAQAKPKRNVALDNNFPVKKNKSLISKQTNKNVSKKRKHGRARSYKPKVATYLTVNGSQSPTLYATSDYDKLIVSVESDVSNWQIKCVGNWYRVYKKSDREIEIDIENNFSHDKRNDWFMISTGNKEVNVYISQLGKPINAYADVSNVYLRHGVMYNGQRALEVNAKVCVTGAAGLRLSFYCFFEYPNGDYIKLNNGECLAYYTNLESPNSDNQTCYNIQLLIPNNDLPIYNRRKGELHLEFKTFCYDNNNYIDRQTYVKGIKARRKKNMVETFEP